MRSILVVDDHPVVQLVMSETARSLFAQAQVSTAGTLAGAIEAARADEAIDLVLLDLGLPDASGEYRYAYDPDTGVLATSADPEGNVTTYAYDANNRLAVITDPLLHSTRIEYDAAGNPAKIIDALGNTVQMISDSAGRIVQTSDALGNDTKAEYNSLNQLTKIVDAKLGETDFNFDNRNNLASVVNPLNNTIESYGYDSIGRLSTKTDATLKSESYGYDGNGNLTTITDRRSQVTTIAYDNANRPVRITYHDGTVQERSYDAVGRLTEIREPDNAQAMEYDTLDRVVKVTTDTLAGRTEIGYEYHALDRRTKRTVSYPGGVLEETTYVYDKASRLLSIVQIGVDGTQTTTYEWDAASRLSQKTLPNGIRQQLAYDEANRLLSITYKRSDESVMEEILYAYDANGQRTVKSSGSPSLKDSAFSASYDAANRMSGIVLNPGTPAQNTYVLTYDEHGNLARKQNANDPSEDTLYTWDARNRLTAISMSEAGQTSTATFLYDALGRRIERTINQGATTQRTQYVYDGIQAIGELQDGRLAATILTGLNIDEVIARTVNVSGGGSLATKSYLTDALGSVLATTLANQNEEIFYAYSSYGETQTLGADQDSPANSSRYTARENDGLVGGTNGESLYYYRARYYDPVLKRFIEEDPIGMAGGTNVYAYGGENPLSYSDPLGLEVYLSGHIAAGMAGHLTTPTSYHFAIVMRPDNPSDFAGLSGWQKDQYGTFATLGAELGLTGNLNSTPNKSGDRPSNGTFFVTVQPPPGMSDTEFIRRLINAANCYKNNLPYSRPDFPDGYMPPGRYNSNSFVAGVIRAAGARPPTIDATWFQTPGYSNPIPIAGCGC